MTMWRTEFWRRMERHLGATYADSFAHDYVIDALGGRTVHQALDAGYDARAVWRAVCDVLELPDRER